MSFLLSFLAPSKDQLFSLFRKALFAYCVAYLSRHGWDVAEVDSVMASAAGLLAVCWSHYVHRPDTSKPVIAPTVLLVLLGLSVWPGCALTRPFVESTTTGTNGVISHNVLKTTSFAFWPATQTMGKEVLANGDKQKLSSSELKQETGSTNVVEALRSLDSILGKVAK